VGGVRVSRAVVCHWPAGKVAVAAALDLCARALVGPPFVVPVWTFDLDYIVLFFFAFRDT
jgi:hypothetical protein